MTLHSKSKPQYSIKVASKNGKFTKSKRDGLVPITKGDFRGMDRVTVETLTQFFFWQLL